VIARGADCPALDDPMLRRAAAALACPGCNTVLGPATDGGCYLLGLRAPCAAIFHGISCRTDLMPLACTRPSLRHFTTTTNSATYIAR
jgi:glycosyltransferase A (GT-A) superfamily protein (DUF2064 family)